MIDRTKIEWYPLNCFLSEYKELNTNGQYRPVAVGRYGIRTRESIYSKELAKDYSKNKLIYKGTLTVGMGSVQMDIGILSDDAVYSVSPAYHTYRITGVDCDYLRYCLQYRNMDMFTRYMKRGSRQGKSIDLSRWITYEIPVYSAESQTEIVERLDSVQRIIDARQQQLSALDYLIKARFVEMFGDPEHNSKSWPVQPLDSLCSVGSSKRIYQNEQSADGVPFWRISDLVSKMDTGVADSGLFIPEEKYLELRQAGLVPMAGDILVTSRGTLGRCYIVQEEDRFYFQDGMISWLSNYAESITPLYLQHLFTMNGLRKQIDGMQAGSTVAYLSIAMLKKLRIMVPSKEAQSEFSTFVAQIDKSKSSIQKSLDETQILFDSLMQKYFG